MLCACPVIPIYGCFFDQVPCWVVPKRFISPIFAQDLELFRSYNMTPSIAAVVTCVTSLSSCNGWRYIFNFITISRECLDCTFVSNFCTYCTRPGARVCLPRSSFFLGHRETDNDTYIRTGNNSYIERTHGLIIPIISLACPKFNWKFYWTIFRQVFFYLFRKVIMDLHKFILYLSTVVALQ